MERDYNGQAKEAASIRQRSVGAADVERDDGGLSQDERILKSFGKKQIFKRRFGFLSIIGLCSTILVSWESAVSGFGPQLVNGGSGGLVWGYVYASIGAFTQALVLAEIASAIPLSGGQFNWVAIMAPPKYSKLLSYIVGWQICFTWHSFLAVTAWVSTASTQTLAKLTHPDYKPERWQQTLMIFATMLICLVFNVHLGRYLPKVESLVLMLHVFGYVVVIFVLLYLTENKTPSSVVWGEFIDGGGFGSVGLSFLVGTVSTLLPLIGIDAAAHLAEEVQNASKTVPITMIGAYILNAATGFSMCLAIVYCMRDPREAIQQYLAGELPYASIFTNALGSRGGAAGLASVSHAIGFTGSISSVAAASRMTYAVAREGAFPASNWLTKLSAKGQLPVNAIMLTIGIDLLLSLINIGSSTAFNAFAGMSAAGYFTTFMITAIVSIHYKLSGRAAREGVPPGPFSMGVFSVPVTILSLCWTVVAYFFSFWPPNPNPSLKEFNWSVIVYVAVFIGAMIHWTFWARHTYKGPLIEISPST